MKETETIAIQKQNELVAIKGESALAISESTKELIQAGVTEDTRKAYVRPLYELKHWLTDGNEWLAGLSRAGRRPGRPVLDTE